MNPIMNRLSPINNALQSISNLRQLAGGNPNAAYQMLINNNPQFRQFVQQNQGKSAEQIARENGIDLNQLKQFL